MLSLRTELGLVEGRAQNLDITMAFLPWDWRAPSLPSGCPVHILGVLFMHPFTHDWFSALSQALCKELGVQSELDIILFIQWKAIGFGFKILTLPLTSYVTLVIRRYATQFIPGKMRKILLILRLDRYFKHISFISFSYSSGLPKLIDVDTIRTKKKIIVLINKYLTVHWIS